jgi:hypothetical protein
VFQYIWNESTAPSLGTFWTFWKQIAGALQDTLGTPMGVGFSVPMLIWILVSFRRGDVFVSIFLTWFERIPR